jgi:hypothetical protein
VIDLDAAYENGERASRDHYRRIGDPFTSWPQSACIHSRMPEARVSFFSRAHRRRREHVQRGHLDHRDHERRRDSIW